MSRYEEVMQRYDALWSAVDFMYNENVSIRKAADAYLISKTSLQRFIEDDVKELNNELYHEIKNQQKKRRR